MRVLDLFSGSGSFSQPFKDRGHEVTTVDIEPKFEPDLIRDVMHLEPSSFFDETIEPIDAILSSPPCTCLSVASIGTHWGGGKEAYIPKTEGARQAIRLLERNRFLIAALRPRFDVTENPRDIARKLPVMLAVPRTTIWYCQYGDERAKPTDLFGHLPKSFIPKTCHNGAKDHAEARRGAKTGTQGRKGAYERSKVPYKLGEELCIAMERELDGEQH